LLEGYFSWRDWRFECHLGRVSGTSSLIPPSPFLLGLDSASKDNMLNIKEGTQEDREKRHVQSEENGKEDNRRQNKARQGEREDKTTRTQ
jgi:hypothetical protein